MGIWEEKKIYIWIIFYFFIQSNFLLVMSNKEQIESFETIGVVFRKVKLKGVQMRIDESTRIKI